MKKTLALLLAAILVIGMFGTAAAEEPVEITFMTGGINEFDEKDNPFTTFFEEKTGVKLTIELAPESAFVERFQIFMSTGDELPELMYMPNGQNALHQNAVDAGQIIALDEWIEKYPNITKYTSPLAWETAKVMDDGKIYALPTSIMNRQDGAYVRKDWLDKFGITVPEDGTITLETFKDILYKFTFEDPDGNGVDDTYGLSLGSNGEFLEPNWLLYGAFNQFGWQKDESGTYDFINSRYDRSNTNFRDNLEFVANLWADGVIDPNWINNTGGMNRTRFMQGIAGMTVSTPGHYVNMRNELKTLFPEAEIVYITRIAKNEGDVVPGAAFGAGTWGSVVVTNTALEKGKVDAIFKLIDYMLSDEGWDVLTNGLEGLQYEVVNGEKVFNAEASDKFENGEKAPYAIMRRYDDARYLLGPANMDPNDAAILTTFVANAMANLKISLNLGYTTDAEREQVYLDYQKEVQATISKILIGELPPSAWDECLEGWYKNGGDAAVEQMNAYLNSKGY